MPKLTRSFRQVFFTGMILLALVSMGLWGAIWIYVDYRDFKTQSQELREKYLEVQEDLLRNQVANVASYIHYMMEQTEIRLKVSIRERVEEAYNISMNLYRQNLDHKTPAEIQKLIKDSLRPIRFNMGRGYFFAFNMNGVEELFADRPEMEGKNMLAVTGARGELVVRDMLDLVHAQNEGFYEYTWTKPHVERKDNPKIAYVKLFEPYGWVLGTGEYLDDVRNEIQDEVLGYISRSRFGTEGYFFGSTFRGEPLFSNGKITKGTGNIWELTDPHGFKIIQEQIRAAKQPEGGFVYYSWPKLESLAPMPKLSYVLGVPKWEWTVGAGVYLDTIELELARRGEILKDNLVTKIQRGVLILLALLLLIFLWVRLLSDRLQSEINTFSMFFEKTATQSVTIDPSELHFLEFQRLAHFSNSMAWERKRAEEALLEIKELFSLFMRYSPIYVFIKEVTSTESRVLQASDNYQQMIGIPGSEMIGKTMPELFPADFAAKITADDWAVVSSGTVLNLEENFGGRNFTTIKFPIVREGSNLLAGFTIDISESKRAEEALLLEKQFSELLLDSLPGIFYLYDGDLRLRRWNRNHETATGFSAEEMWGRFIGDWFPLEANRGQILKGMRWILDKGVPGTQENALAHKDGQQIPYIFSGVRLDTPEGPMMMGVGIDISDRIRAEEALRESEAKFSLAFKHAPMMAVISVLEDGTYLDVNDKFEDLSGFTRVDVLGKTSIEIGWLRSEDRQRLIDTLQMKGKVSGLEITSYARNGRPVECLYHCEFITLGGVKRLLTMALDITERKRAEEERLQLEERLQRAEKMEALGTLAGGVAHDLNNVLGIVVGYSELLLDDLDKSSPARTQAMEILKGGQRAAAIVQDLLTLARRGVHSRKVLNLNNIVLECQNSPEFRKLLSMYPHIRVKTDFEADLLNASGSPIHLMKSIFNLASNAAEAMPNGGLITIKTRNHYLDKPIHGYDEVKEGDYVVVSVRDTGEGIPSSDLKRIFEPFYTKKVMGRSGTGLGLAVVWGTVKDHLGYINVESEEGKGTLFTLYFPVSREETTLEKVSVSAAEYMGNGESILVVDDVKEQRELAEKMLAKLNYSAESVSSGEDALEYLRRHPVDLIVLDMIMDPGLDGLDTYRKVLEIHPLQKAIIVSGFAETERVKEAQSLGAGAYVKKPYVLERLGLAVRKELDRVH